MKSLQPNWRELPVEAKLELLERLRLMPSRQPEQPRPSAYAHDPVGYVRDILKVPTLTPDQQDILRHLLIPPYKVLVPSGHSTGKCVAADELIPLADGRLMPARELVGRYFGVLAFIDDGKQIPALAFAADNGVKPVYRIQTSSGRTVLRTGNHPLLLGEKILRNGHPKVNVRGWMPINELKIADVVLVPTVLHFNGRQPAEEDHIKLLAYLLGDGGITHGITFTQKEGIAKDEFYSIVKRLGSRISVRDELTVSVAGPLEGNQKTIGRNPVMNLARQWGITGKRSKEKFFPAWVWELPNEQLALFLNRLFACDGYAYSQEDKNIGRIGIASASERIVRDVELAMLRFGICGRVRYKPVNLNGKIFKSWEWVIHTGPEIIRFSEAIGIFGKEDAVARAVKMANNLDQTKTKKWRFKYAPSGYLWDTITRIDLVGEMDTVAIYVPGPHTFLTTFVEHNTFIGAAALNYWFDSFNPGAVFTLGPRYDSLKDTLWAEVRLQRQRAGLSMPFIGPAAPEMRDAPNHWAKGLTATKDAALTGRHLPKMLFVIEEAVAVDPIFWQVVQTMFDPALGHAMLCIFNPTDTTSHAKVEDDNCSDADGRPRWHRFRLSVLNHPNVLAELRGEPKPIPHAVGLAMVNDMVRDWCDPISQAEARQPDIEWPPGSGNWHRSGPVFQARALGLWPETGSGLWSDALFESCINGPKPPFLLDRLPEVGCDTAMGKGDDFHAITGRWGAVACHHETANDMDPLRIFGRIKENCKSLADLANRELPVPARNVKPEQIRVKLDDDGVGHTIAHLLWRAGYTCRPIGAGTRAFHEREYPNMRSELWFQTVEQARQGNVYLGMLDKATLRRLKRQLLAPQWDQNAAGQRVVERKDVTKEKIGRSPDDADSLQLAFLEGVKFEPPKSPADMPQTLSAPDRYHSGQSAAQRRGLFGYGR